MEQPKYNIGDYVWSASFEATETYVTCPDCGGTGHIKCTIFDGTEYHVECSGCSRGYLGPYGKLTVYDRVPTATLVQIIGIEIGSDGVRYRSSAPGGYTWTADEGDLASSEAEAMTIALAKADEMSKGERDRIARKEKDTRSWAWHVHYYRKEIRDAQNRIDHATAKLAIASLKAKERA